MGARRVELLERRFAYEGHFRMLRYRIRHEQFSGEMGPVLSREVFERGWAACVLPYDPARDEVVLVEQFRMGAYEGGADDPWMIEPIAGIVEPGETPEDVARREAREEAGLEIGALIEIADYFTSPGGASEHCKAYIGRADTRHAGGVHGLDGEGEDIRVHVLPFDEALRWLRGGRLRVSTTLITMQWLALNIDEVRRRFGAAAA